MLFKTRHNQTPIELATEFKTALQQIEAGPSIKQMTDIYLAAEKREATDNELLAMYEKHFIMGTTTIYDLEIMKRGKFNCSKTFLYWLAQMSGQNTQMFACLIGLFATLFYSTHAKNEQMNFKWLAEENLVKFIQYKDFFYWYMAAKLDAENPDTVFDHMTAEDFYSFKV